MLNAIKDMAAKQVGKVLASEATMRVLNSAELRNAVVTAINLRAGAREVLEARVKELAATLELVTREDVAHLRRSMRDLEDHIAELREQLERAQEELAASKGAEAHGAAAEAKSAAPAPTQEAAGPEEAPSQADARAGEPEVAEPVVAESVVAETAQKKPRKSKAN